MSNSFPISPYSESGMNSIPMDSPSKSGSGMDSFSERSMGSIELGTLGVSSSKMTASSSSSSVPKTSEKSAIKLLDIQIAELFARRTECLKKGEGIENDKELNAIELDIERAFTRLDDVFSKILKNKSQLDQKKEKNLVGADLKESEEKIERAEQDENSKTMEELAEAVNFIFSLEYAVKEQLNQEMILGYLSGNLRELSEEDRKLLKSDLNTPDKADQRFTTTLLSIVNRELGEKNTHFQKLGEVYLKTISLEKRAKAVLTALNPMANLAANVGKAATVGYTTIKNRQTITPQGKSAQQVFLEDIAVLKKPSPRAREEEYIFGQVSKFFSPFAILDSYRMSEAIPSRLGYSMSTEEERSRGYPYQSDSGLVQKLREKIPVENEEALKKFLASSSKSPEEVPADVLTEPQKVAFAKCKERTWTYTAQNIKDKEKTITKVISFKELQKLCLTEGLDILRKLVIQPIPEDTERPESVPTVEEIQQVLQVNVQRENQRQNRIEDVYFVPVLEGSFKIFYEKLAGYTWILPTTTGEKTLTFKELQQLFIKEEMTLDELLQARPKGTETALEGTERIKLHEALKVRWRAVLPTVMVSNSKPLQDFDVKVHIKDMLLIADLMEKEPKMLNGIVNRLTPEAEQQMMLTLTMQTLDLHSSNVGFRPISTPGYEAAKQKYPDFYSYQKKFLSGLITETTLIPRSSPPKTFGQDAELFNALQAPWEIVLFDTDMSLGESNLFEKVHDKHLIPIRSAFLYTRPMREKAFTPQSLELVRKEEANMPDLKAWIKGADRPVQRKLASNPEFNRRVFAHVQPMIDKQSFAQQRKREPHALIKDLSKNFSLECSDISKESHLIFWKDYETQMSHQKSKEGETLKEFSLRHHLNFEKVKSLNESLVKYGEDPLPKDTAVRMEDLTSTDPAAQANRVKISKQLFPRMTSRQEKALFDRKQAQTNYLKAHSELQAFFSDPSKTDVVEMQEVLKKYLKNPHTPKISPNKQVLFDIVNETPDIEYLKYQGKKLIAEHAPNYLRMADVMYPLLGHEYGLVKATQGENIAGRAIGDYSYPLEAMIPMGLKAGPSSDAYELATELQEELRKANEPGAIDPPSLLR